MDNAALHLKGRELANGWIVGEMMEAAPDATGGHFSVAYPVEKKNGALGFLKVLNLAQAFNSSDVVNELLRMTSHFAAERDLCIMCGEQRLSKVVTAMDHGQLSLPEYGPLGTVSYIVFELATHDVRRAMSIGAGITDVIRLEYLHNIAVGLQQLHSVGVAHQDLKPSNFLVFVDGTTDRASGKLADLGRAYRSGFPQSIDLLILPGDRNYAPPEQLYRFAHSEERARRYAPDLYQLGSMASFLFTGQTMNARLANELDSAHHWHNFGDSFADALPYVEAAYSKALASLAEDLTGAPTDEVMKIVTYLCEPNPDKRGHPVTRRQRHGSPFALNRVVSDIDQAARRASLAVTR